MIAMNVVDVSIVIVCYNDAAVLLPCLESIYALSADVSFEVIVVDNNSNDGGPAEVRRRFPRAEVFEAGYNSGYAGGNNIGFERARGRYVMFLNPDTILGGRVLDSLVERADSTPNCGAIGPNVRNTDGSLQRSVFRSPTLADFVDYFLLDRLPGYARFFGYMGYRDADYEREQEVDIVCGCCFMARRDLLQKIGAFDEEYFIYFEEADLCERIRASGHKVIYSPTASIVHLGAATTAKQEAWFRIRAERSRHRFFTKHRSRMAVVALTPLLFVNSVVRASLGTLAVIVTAGASRRLRRKAGTELTVFFWQIGLVAHGPTPPAATQE